MNIEQRVRAANAVLLKQTGLRGTTVLIRAMLARAFPEHFPKTRQRRPRKARAP